MNLASAQASWTTECLDALVINLVQGRTDQIFTRVHNTLASLITLVPTAIKPLFDQLRHHFPFFGRDIEVHAIYVANLLKVSSYAPVLREKILGLLVDRMVDIDVQIFIVDEDARSAELAAVAAAAKLAKAKAIGKRSVAGEYGDEDDDGMMFEMETDVRATGSTTIVAAAGAEPSIAEMTPAECASEAAARCEADGVHAMADKLDIMMELVFQHLAVYSRAPDMRAATFECMLRAFDQVHILPNIYTYG